MGESADEKSSNVVDGSLFGCVFHKGYGADQRGLGMGGKKSGYAKIVKGLFKR